MPQFELQGQRIDYSVRISKRAKRVLVKLQQETGLEVVYPTRRRQPAPEEVLQGNADWILRAMKRLSDASAAQPQRSYRSGEVYHFRGQPYSLRLSSTRNGDRARVKLARASLALHCHAEATLDERRQAVVAWYRQQAKTYMPQRTRELADQHGFRYGALRIKHQKTRWGSCSAKGNLNFNLRLMMAPDAAIDYVIIHELCHLRELNHSQAFWGIVAAICPEYRHWRAWLQENGHRLKL